MVMKVLGHYCSNMVLLLMLLDTMETHHYMMQLVMDTFRSLDSYSPEVLTQKYGMQYIVLRTIYV